MAIGKNDGRLSRDQEKWLHGRVLRWARWTRPTPTWDYDLCEFCWQEFCDSDHDVGDRTQPLTAGYGVRGPYEAEEKDE